MAETVSSYPGLYPLGAGAGVVLTNGNAILSNILNARDLYTPGAGDFVLLGPGSQVWVLGYSVTASPPFPFFPGPPNPLGLELELDGGYSVAVPFFFQAEQRIILPVYENIHHYAGRARLESPAAHWTLSNGTGIDLEVSFQFWGKAL